MLKKFVTLMCLAVFVIGITGCSKTESEEAADAAGDAATEAGAAAEEAAK